MKSGWQCLLVLGIAMGCSNRDAPPPTTAAGVVAYYQRHGFFAGRAPAEVLAAYEREWGELPNPQQPWDDVFLLARDERVVWSGDPEMDVCDENRVYSDLLLEWSAISHGAFEPRDIEERWSSERGPIELRITLAGQRHAIRPSFLDDWVDLSILTKINERVGKRQFAYAADGNFAIVVCLEADVLAKIVRERRLPLER